MANKVRSLRGEIVDFDLFQIKSRMLQAPVTNDTKQREQYISKRRRRVLRNKLDDIVANNGPQAEVHPVSAEEPPIKNLEPQVVVKEEPEMVEPTATIVRKVRKGS